MKTLLYPRLTAPLLVSLSEQDCRGSEDNQGVNIRCKKTQTDPTPVCSICRPEISLPLHLKSSGSDMSGELSLSTGADSLRETGATPGIYDLKMQIGNCTFVEPHAVRLFNQIPAEYTFCLLTDFHLYPPYTSFPFRLSVAHVRKCLAQAMQLRPEFLLFCGDVSSLIFFYPWSVAAMRRLLIEEVSCPVFFVPGNHDGYLFRLAGLTWWDGWVYWQQHLGPLYQSFDFGQDHFIGLNTFDWQPARRNIFSRAEFLTFRFRLGAFISDEQIRWLERDISEARKREQRIFFFLHHSPLHSQFFRPNGQTLKGTWEGTNRERVLELICESHAVAVFCGHQHYTAMETWEGIPFFLTASSASYNEPGFDYAFKKITIRNGVLASVETIPFQI
ncbi:MAG TPA: metallophosphoesterase [bacterium]|nr:metallophosphoesterase [bacterium]